MYGLFIDNFQPAVDGVATVVYNYAMEMYRRQCDVCVVAPDARGRRELPEPFPVKRIPSIPLPPRPPYSVALPFAPSAVTREVRRMPFDLIHSHAPFPTGHMGRRIAQKRGIPFIASFRSKYWDDFYTATRCRLVADIATKVIIDFYMSADQVWITDPSVLETMRKYGYKGKRDQVVVVPNGMEHVEGEPAELRRRKRSELGLDDDTPLFLFVGQQVRVKNVELIIRSLALLGDRKFLFYSIGKGPELSMFVELARELGLEDRAIFPGVIRDRTELFSYYAAADLFLFPSFYDTYGNVIREAALMHTPSLLVAGSTCAAPFTDGADAFIASSDDPQVYADKIIETMRDTEGRHRVGERIPHTLCRSWEDVVDEVVDRYDFLIAHNRACSTYCRV